MSKTLKTSKHRIGTRLLVLNAEQRAKYIMDYNNYLRESALISAKLRKVASKSPIN
jgi:hypothetical protein